MLVMCHLFGRRQLPAVYSSKEIVKELTRKSPSMLVLPPLPDDARSALLSHDAEILRIFSGYALTYSEQHEGHLSEEHRLPVSGKSFSVLDANRAEDSVFRAFLQSSAVEVTARSLFVANSGHDDRFSSVPELTKTARRGLHLNDHAIPSLHHITALPAEGKGTFPLNAYLLDYYIHGQKKAVVTANGIREGELWFVLEDFTLCLKAIRSSLEKLLLGVAEGDGDADDGAVDPAEMDNVEADPTPSSTSQTLDVRRLKKTEKPALAETQAAGLAPAATSAQGTSASGDKASNSDPDLVRPPGVSDRNWNVFRVVHRVTVEFEQKFRAMWA